MSHPYLNQSASSSDDDDAAPADFRQHINLPRVDLQQFRKQHTQPRSLAEAGKLAGKRISSVAANIERGKQRSSTRQVRIPDLERPAEERQRLPSISSTTNSSSSDDDTTNIPTPGQEVIPSFSFGKQARPAPESVELDSASDIDDDEYKALRDQPSHLDLSGLLSSDSDSDSNSKSGRRSNSASRPSGSSRNVPTHKSSKASLGRASTTGNRRPSNESRPADGLHRHISHGSHTSHVSGNIRRHFSRLSRNPLGEIDITDQSAPLIALSSKTGDTENTGGFKGLLRRMTQTDASTRESAGMPSNSNSETFMGRILGSGHGGLTGGGLAPGATHASRDRPLDDEERLDTINEDQTEMRPIDPEELSEEAKKLISVHVPGLTPQTVPTLENPHPTAEHSPTGSSAGLMGDHPRNSQGEEISRPSTPAGSFYAPNPDLFVRRDENVERNGADNFLLDDGDDGDYVPPPKHVHAGVLSSLLKLYQNPQDNKSEASIPMRGNGGRLYDDEDDYSDANVRTERSDFTKWKNGFKKAPKLMTNTAGKGKRFIKGMGGNIKNDMVEAGEDVAHAGEDVYEAGEGVFKKKSKSQQPPNLDSASDSESFEADEKEAGAAQLPSFQNAKPKAPKLPQVSKKVIKSKLNHKRAQQLRITVHIADILQRQMFIMRLCRALMLWGAPTHRLEEYMVMTSRVLEIDGQFIYFPGCMIVSFGDAATRTSEVHLIRCAQGVNLSKLSDSHKIYKAVVHDLIGVEDAAKQLDALFKAPNLRPAWLCVLLYGLGSAMVTPFAFSGGWRDIPIAFGVGCCVGFLQFYVLSKSNLYSSVFEVTSSIVVSFISRAIGTIKGGQLFCFSAIAQGSLALILPGYIILCGSMELQSRNLVAGSVRMFYAIIYSLFLGFGITLGGALYGWIDKNAVSGDKCQHALDDRYKILFVPMFSLALGLINQARWRQLPVMIIISCTGYVGNFFAGKHFSTVTEFTACIGAFIVGIMGNLYSRIWKGMAVSAMLPAIFVQVPSGIASQSSLTSGIANADQITGHNTTRSTSAESLGSLNFGVTMVEVSIGISVGLFAAALFVYPFGKKRTSLFTM